MKNTLYSTLITLIIAITLTFTTNTPAQDSPQWHLPDGATARFGKGTIHQITYSPDSTKMAVATSIGIWIYDTETGDELNLLSGHTEAVDSVAFHPEMAIYMLASGSRDDTVRLWDVETGIEMRSLTAHTRVRSIPLHLATTAQHLLVLVRIEPSACGIPTPALCYIPKGHTRSIAEVAIQWRICRQRCLFLYLQGRQIQCYPQDVDTEIGGGDLSEPGFSGFCDFQD